ncbi:MAG: hypothetical protein AB1646_11375 [Thermodesulfobacteriota bacterium]
MIASTILNSHVLRSRVGSVPRRFKLQTAGEEEPETLVLKRIPTKTSSLLEKNLNHRGMGLV